MKRDLMMNIRNEYSSNQFICRYENISMWKVVWIMFCSYLRAEKKNHIEIQIDEHLPVNRIGELKKFLNKHEQKEKK